MTWSPSNANLPQFGQFGLFFYQKEWEQIFGLAYSKTLFKTNLRDQKIIYSKQIQNTEIQVRQIRLVYYKLYTIRSSQRKNYKIEMSNNKLIQLIYGALKSDGNNIVRENAEKQIFELRQSNPNEFFIQCASLLINHNENDFIRQSASTLLINSVRAKYNNIYFWDLLQPQTRNNVKTEMLNTLVDPNPIIMKSGANVISHIAVIEIPRHEWLDLVDVLAENTIHQDINVRKASIITIGNICQQFHYAAVSVEPRACQQFLAGIIVGTKQKNDQSILQESMKALRNSLSFLKPILSEEIYRNQVLKIIYEHITTSDNEDRSAYEAMIEFCKICYEYLGSYLKAIIQMISNHIQQRNDNTILALELLDTIGSEYLQRVQDAEDRTNQTNLNIVNYLIPLQVDILPEVMRCLLIQNKNDLDFPEMRNSAAKTLSTFASIGDRQTVDIIANGTATCLRSTQIGHQQATAVLLSTLCENPDKDYVIQITTNAFQPVLGLLSSSAQIIILNTLNGLATIAEFHPYLFYDNKNIRQILDKFFELMDPKNINVTTAILVTLKNITQNLQSSCVLLTQTSLLLTRIVNCYEQFLDNFQGPSKDYTEKCVLIIMNCLVKLKNREVILFMIDFLVPKYYFYYDSKVQDKQVRLSSIASIIHTCILALENMIPKEGTINNLCTLINKHLQLFGVQQEGLNLISAMAITFNKAFEPRTQKYWAYLEAGLQQISQPRTFKVALCCVGDFSRVYAETFMSKQLALLERLLVLIHEGFDRQTKLNILACIADLMLGLGHAAEPFLGKIVDMVDISFQAVYQLSNNPNERDYVQELKRALIDMYACVTFSINGKADKKKSQILFNHFPIVATFVVRTCNRSQNPTIDYLKICLFLIFDSATFYWKNEHHRNTFRNILESEQIKSLVKILQNFKQKDDIRELQAIIEQRYLAF